MLFVLLLIVTIVYILPASYIAVSKAEKHFREKEEQDTHNTLNQQEKPQEKLNISEKILKNSYKKKDWL